ncbi:CBO0543 family protein [Alteribacillus iranensis]|uniref:Uncharacterized protein n=1 Tax=Alteribacillus iranensis TaxID=930128 RepID=A0A1I2EW54_9BACI|nr:CBO0543 family protein [Alteribacillus iranensis]SFE96706.1 hypothetical protein SAMN05192532_10717 [Alteribacillus iranensis]
MNDRSILRFITVISLSGLALLFKKGSVKDWFLVFLFKSLLSTFLDIPVTEKRLVKYPVRYFPKYFKTNIVFDYILFPLTCVIYSQITYKWKPIQAILGVFLLSVPMTVAEEILNKKTNLIQYGKKWNWTNSFSYLTATFLASRFFITGIRFISERRER